MAKPRSSMLQWLSRADSFFAAVASLPQSAAPAPPVRRFWSPTTSSGYAVSPLTRARAACKRAGIPYLLIATPLVLALLAMCVVVAMSAVMFRDNDGVRSVAGVGGVGVGGVFGGGERAIVQAGRERKAREASPLLVAVEEADVRPGVALVAACRNRQTQLRETLPTWLALRHVNDIVIVDWGSDPPLRDVVMSVTGNPRVTVVRVDSEEDWVLSRAYNLAVGVTAREKILRTDCDYAIAPGFVHAHELGRSEKKKKTKAIGDGSIAAVGGDARGTFYAGNYRMARDENEVHLNGAMFFYRQDFMNVGGYDERIQTYGWDDTDLYARLGASGLKQKNVSYDHVRHVQHSDSKRVQKNVQFAQVEIDINQLLLSHLKKWSPEIATGADPNQAGTVWLVSQAGGPSNYISVWAGSSPRPLRRLVGPDILDKEVALALGRRLSDQHQVPWDIIGSMDVKTKRAVLSQLDTAAAKLKAEKGQVYALANRPRLLFVHTMHGLGNRLRALASGLSFAKATGRVLVLVWETDAHISAGFGDLFTTEIPVITTFRPAWPFAGNERWDKSWRYLHAVNYMSNEGHGAVKDAFIDDRPGMHIYFKSSSIMQTRSSYGGWDMDNAQLQKLQPVPEVMRAVEDHVVRSGLMSRVGMHIRDRTLERDIHDVNATSEYGTSASDTMDYWRRKSSHHTFAVEMRHLLAVDRSMKFYIATDTREVLDTLAREFPGRVLSTHRDCDSRNAHCVRFALIDVLSLSRTRRLYGSNWSSFTELAQRLGGPKALLAGQDFGKDEAEPERR